MAMNFVTFNQDYSHLAVGEIILCLLSRGLADKARYRHLERLPHIYHRTFSEMLRNQRRRHCHPRDALFDVAGSSHIVTKETTDHKYQGMLREGCGRATSRQAHADGTFPCYPETFNHLRTDISNHCTCSTTKPEEVGGRTGRPDISIRHQQYEALAYHRNIS